MPSAETFWGTIIGTMVVVTILAFIGLYQANLAPSKKPLSLDETWGVFIAALVIGVIGGGVLGLLIFVAIKNMR